MNGSAKVLAAIALAVASLCRSALAAEPHLPLPTGQWLTPLAAPGASYSSRS